MEERNSRGSIWIILYGGDFGRNSGFVPFKIDNPVVPLIPAPAVPACDAAMNITAALFFEDF
jgi:hypothetical protein